MKSAIAAAAYRSGETLYDEQADQTYDYTRKEGVVHSEIMVPDNAPAWVTNLSRQALWNMVEANEKRKDAQLARDVVVSLPRELNHEQQIALVREFVREHFTEKGMIADFALHDKQASDGLGSQPHAHILLTMRDLDRHGFGKKNRQWNEKKLLQEWRSAWEECTNRHLEMAGRPERMSMKSYKEQGIDKTPKQYLSMKEWKQEQRGIRTEKGNRNRRRKHFNRLGDKIKNLRLSEREELPPGPVQAIGEGKELGQVARLLANAGSDGDASGGGAAQARQAPLVQQRRQERRPERAMTAREWHQQQLHRSLKRMTVSPVDGRASRLRWSLERIRGNWQRALTWLAARLSNQEIAEKLRKEEERAYER